MRLRTKFALYYAFGIFAPIVVVTFLAYYVASNEVKKAAFFNLQQVQREAQREIDGHVRALQKDFIQFLTSLEGEPEAFLISRLKEYVRTLGESFAYLIAFEKDTATLKIERRFGPCAPKLFVDFSQRQVKDTLEVIEPDIGGYTFGMKGKIEGSDKRVLMRLKIPVFLENILEKYYIRDRRFIYATSKGGVVLYHPDAKYIGRQDEPTLHNNLLVSRSSFDTLGISLVSVEDPSPLLAPFRSSLRIIVVFTFVVLLISLFLSYRVLGDVFETVKSLAFESRNLAEGKGIRPLFHKRRDELGEIARHLNQIAVELYDSAQLKAFHRVSAFVTHDLKNLLAQMSLLLRNLEVHYEKPGFKEDAIFTLKSSVEEMSRLIQSLKPAKRKSEPLNLKDLIEEALKRFNLQGRKDIEIELDLKDALVEGDRREVLSIFTNVMSNSLDAMKRGGKLSVKMYFEDPWIIVKIKDTGVGMTKEFMDTQLFRPFSTTKEKGLGLGLFQVRETLKSMEGKIEIESSIGEGTSVTLFFKSI